MTGVHVSSKYLIWDFDGTLAYREGMWRGALRDALRQMDPTFDCDDDQLRPYLRDGFPWHRPERVHPGQTADQWWEGVYPVFERAFCDGAGLSRELAARLARRVRSTFTDLRAWHLFDDTLTALGQLREAGWRHVVLTNHVPELPQVIAALELGPLIEAVFNSAETGYEKPHPQAFGNVLDRIGPAEQVWMIGDNPVADVQGAQAAGLPAILVRHAEPLADGHSCDGLGEVLRIVEGGSGK